MKDKQIDPAIDNAIADLHRQGFLPGRVFTVEVEVWVNGNHATENDIDEYDVEKWVAEKLDHVRYDDDENYDSVVCNVGRKSQYAHSGVDKVNGHRVIGSFLLPYSEGLRLSRVILVQRNRANDAEPEFVVAQHCIGDDEWCQGHYFLDIGDAVMAFNELCVQKFSLYRNGLKAGGGTERVFR